MQARPDRIACPMLSLSCSSTPMPMRRKRTHPPRRWPRILLGLFLAILLLATVGSRESSLSRILTLEGVGVGQRLFHWMGEAAAGVWDRYIALVRVREENKRLRAEIDRLRQELAANREAANTALLLRRLLQFRETIQPPPITATVIGRDPSLFSATMIVDRGATDDVFLGMPAVTAEGVVGQVVEVAPRVAKVLLATDPNSAIDVLDQRSRVQGILKGNGQNYIMEYVLKGTDVQKDDIIVTSGMNGLFPKGLVLGVVSKVIQGQRGMFQQIFVRPAVDFHQLEAVLLIPTERLFPE